MEDSATGVLSLHRETKFILGFDFAVTPSSPESFSWSFRHHFRTLCRTEVAHVKRRQKMIPFITSPWSACLRVGFWCKMYLIWILGSKLILSINQSRATLWVLETCLIVGLLPFMIILITASLSSNTHNKASWCKIVRLREQDQHYPNHWSFFEIACARESCEDKQRVSPFYHGSEFCFQRLKQSDPINQQREFRLISILHPKRWFLILSNCVKLKFASHTSNLFEQIKCMTSKTHNVPPDVDFI